MQSSTENGKSNRNMSSKDKKQKGKGEKKKQRPPNAFMIFSQENRPLIQQEFPRLTNAEISKRLGEKWRNLHPNKKDIYREKAERIKEGFKVVVSSPLEKNVQSSPSPSFSQKRQREEEVQIQQPEKIQKTDEVSFYSPLDDFEPLLIPPESSQDWLLSVGLDLPEDQYFLQTLIDANRALNLLASPLV